MYEQPTRTIPDEEILRARPRKNGVSLERPYAYLIEEERSRTGAIVPVATLFLTNRECPLRCLMCDLWKNTTDAPTPVGSIPAQIDFALANLPPARQIKLYNSGNFFDPQAIPVADYPAIAQRVRGFDTVIVENHPAFCGQRCRVFRDQLDTELEVAMGLETIQPDILAALNKRMTVADFQRAVLFLLELSIRVRAFILLKPPFQSEQQGIEGALKTIAFAIREGIECCSIIPTRAGNGIMDQLEQSAEFSPPRLTSLEQVHEEGLRISGGKGRVFVDLWDSESLAGCPDCHQARRERLGYMNLHQRIPPPITCHCGGKGC
jgi:archaeosine synthase beta-subunit